MNTLSALFILALASTHAVPTITPSYAKIISHDKVQMIFYRQVEQRETYCADFESTYAGFFYTCEIVYHLPAEAYLYTDLNGKPVFYLPAE